MILAHALCGEEDYRIKLKYKLNEYVMPTEVKLAPCMMEALRLLFPNLKWKRIKFYIGLPFPIPKEEHAITLHRAFLSTKIYFKPEYYKVYSKAFFGLVVHELVHAQQIQDSFLQGFGVGILSDYTYSYFAHWAVGKSVGEKNKMEREANRFQKEVTACMGDGPCLKQNILTRNNNYFASGPCNNVIFSKSTAIRLFDKKVTLANAIYVTIYSLGVIFPLTIITLSVIIVLAFVDLLVGLVRSLVNLFWPGPEPVKIMLSDDAMATFSDPLTIGQSTEPPAIAIESNRLFLLWTNDDKLNQIFIVLTGSQPEQNIFEQSSTDSGPAITTDGSGNMYLAWQRANNELFLKKIFNSNVDDNPRVRIPGKVPDDASPGIAYFNSCVYAAWIRKRDDSKKFGLILSRNDGQSWEHEMTIEKRSHSHGRSALAAGDNMLFLAWSGSDQRKIRILIYEILHNGTLLYKNEFDSGETTSENSGPNIWYDNGKLYLSWIGNGNNKINLATYNVINHNLIRDFKRTFDYKARSNAGVSVAANLNMVALTWTADD